MTEPVRPDPLRLPGCDLRALDDPAQRFALWWADAVDDQSLEEPAALVLATVDAAGRPSARVVLLRAFDARGFVFYTNLESRKGRELQARPACALCLYHPPLHRQIRIEGDAVVVDDAEADTYFAGRPRDSQMSAWASDQSRPLGSEQVLGDRIAVVADRYGDGPIPRPPFWSGFRVVPAAMEFWQEGPFRRHRRDSYLRVGDRWQRSLLFP